jgi:hypothetical protein
MESDFSYIEIKNFIISILPALIIAPVIFLAIYYYNKHVRYQPKLAVSFNKPKPRSIIRKTNHLELLWISTVSIKNQSKHTSYDITGKFALGPHTLEHQSIDTLSKPSNPLESDGSMDIEVQKKIFRKSADFLPNSADYEQILHNPEEDLSLMYKLKVEETDDVKFYLKYKNQFGRTFYNRFRKINGMETNSYSVFRPYLFNDFFFRMKGKLTRN